MGEWKKRILTMRKNFKTIETVVVLVYMPNIINSDEKVELYRTFK